MRRKECGARGGRKSVELEKGERILSWGSRKSMDKKIRSECGARECRRGVELQKVGRVELEYIQCGAGEVRKNVQLENVEYGAGIGKKNVELDKV